MSQLVEVKKDQQEEVINFCLSKCGCGYCSAMKGLGGYPCLEYVCEFCPKVVGMTPAEKGAYCKFCKGER